jgi:hypothetical protein
MLHGLMGASHASAASNWSIKSRYTLPSECSCRIATSACKYQRQFNHARRQRRRPFGDTYHVPKPETALDLERRILDARESLLANFKRESLELLQSFRVRVTHTLPAVDVRKCIQVNLGEDAKAGIDLRLEWKRQRDVQVIVPLLPCIRAQEHI